MNAVRQPLNFMKVTKWTLKPLISRSFLRNLASSIRQRGEHGRFDLTTREPPERNDKAATWQSRAGLDPSASALHADIWERWIALALDIWRSAGFDRTKTWREQDVGLRKSAFNEFKAMVKEDDEMSKFPVLMDDGCMRFKMRRLHSYFTKELERKRRLMEQTQASQRRSRKERNISE